MPSIVCIDIAFLSVLSANVNFIRMLILLIERIEYANSHFNWLFLIPHSWDCVRTSVTKQTTKSEKPSFLHLACHFQHFPFPQFRKL
ncbi:hypothetical protein JHK82_035218 [Glycine max]|nr:hypothetical protein JHK82_035218 [Glycine max]